MKFKFRSRSASQRRSGLQRSTSGFTLLEMTIIVAIIGILFAVSAPGWTAFRSRQQLNIAQNEVLEGIRSAQSLARLQHIGWQASFREFNGIVQWAIHPAKITPANAQWQSLDPVIHLDEETTLLQTGGVHRIQFSDDGRISGQLGRLTLSGKHSNAKRCIIFSTLLGAMRTSQENPKQQDGKSCY